MKANAIYVDCPGMSNPLEHAMGDHCRSCAPFWEKIPTCPIDGKKLTTKGYCKFCRKHYSL